MVEHHAKTLIVVCVCVLGGGGMLLASTKVDMMILQNITDSKDRSEMQSGSLLFEVRTGRTILDHTNNAFNTALTLNF